VLAALLLAVTAAQAPAEPSLQAARIQASVQVDGLLDEAAWALAEPATGFRQRELLEGEPATEATELRVLYDDANLHVGVRALDREPERVIARVLQRDRILQGGLDAQAVWAGDDGVAILIDPFHDHRNAFLFATNANGAEFDALVTDEKAAYNTDWRAVFRVAARRTSEGWSAEFAIPFRSLRYPTKDGSQPWGFNVERFIRRKSEETLWSGWSRAEGGLHRVSRAGHLRGSYGSDQAVEHAIGEPPDHEALDTQAGQLQDLTLVVVLVDGAGLGREQPVERQPVNAHHLAARLAVACPAQPVHEGGDHQVDRPPAGERLHLVERPDRLAVAGEVDPGLLERLAHRGRGRARVGRLRAPTREAHVPRPGVRVVLRAPDEEQLEAAGRGVAQDERHRRARGAAGDAARLVPGERGERLPGDHARPVPASASKARACVSQRNAMFGASSPATSSASSSAGVA
jgi:hypothetical protein